MNNKDKTRLYYNRLSDSILCSCAYCKNYYKQIRQTYPSLTHYLAGLGIDIAKPWESNPLEVENGKLLYSPVQYLVMGEAQNFHETQIDGVTITLPGPIRNLTWTKTSLSLN
jgi:hypothetical protein